MLPVPCQDPDRSVLIENDVSPARKRLRQAFDAVAVSALTFQDFSEPSDVRLHLPIVLGLQASPRPPRSSSGFRALSRWQGSTYRPDYRPPQPVLPLPLPLAAPSARAYQPPPVVEAPLQPTVLQPSFRALPALHEPLPDTCHSPASATTAPAVVPSTARISVQPSVQSASMASSMDSVMASLARRWLVHLQSLGTRSGLMSEALQSASPNLHLVRVLKKYAPSTLTRYFAVGFMVLPLPRALLLPCLPSVRSSA